MSTSHKSFDEISKRIIEFNKVRGWHDTALPDLAKSVIIEAAELLEHFQWDESSKGLSNKTKGIENKDIEEIQFEVADVIWYLIIFCNKAGIDITDCLEKKYAHNNEKYSIELFKNGHNEENYRKRKMEYRKKKALKNAK
jgi:NTP pyrophosphatase (non-canonical NTP hydrolase)